MGSLLEPKQQSKQQDELGSAEADEESIALLRELVERLSTKDGKTISWSTLVKILEEQDPSRSEDLGRCLSDGCRVIRELPARSVSEEVKEGKSRPSFRFKVPYSMRCIPDIDVGLPQVRDDDASLIDFSQKPSLTNSSNDGKSRGRGNTINKKRKSLREQSYSRSEVALKDNTVHEGGLGCEDEEVEEDELSDEDQHDFDANIHGDCERSACGSNTCEDEVGMHSHSSERRRGSGWHRCQGVWQPFSHAHKARRRLAIQTRLRARQLLKSKKERGKEENELLDSTASSSAAAKIAIVPEVDKKGSGRKPSRVERRTAALRKESANAKGKPTLAELRARNGKVATPAVAATAAAKEVNKKDGTTTTATAVGRGDPPPPPGSAPSKNRTSAPTCSFTFTSRSMAANRLVVMRAELNHLRRNLEEARKEFHDLQRQESQASQQRLVEGGGPSLTDDSVLRAANTLHDRLTNSANALSALSSQAAQTQAQAQLLAQAPSPTQTAMVRPQALTKESKQEAAAASAAAVTHSSHAKKDDVGKGLKGQYVQTSTGDRVFVTDEGKVVPCGADEQGKTPGTWKLVGKIPLPMPCPHTSKREPLSAATTNVNGGLVSGLVEAVSIGASPEQSPCLSRTISSKTPSPPPPPSQPLSQPQTHLQQQKSPPPLSRRKKANMANIHHISNHKPRRQVKEAQPGVSLSHSHSQHDDSIPPGLDHPTSTTLLFSDEWMCVFCEYKLLYGEYPRMMGAVKSRKKLVAKKKEAQDRAHRATTVGASNSAHSRAQCTCGRAHARALDYVAKEFGMDNNSSKKADHDHDHGHHHHHHHNHNHDHGGEHHHSHREHDHGHEHDHHHSRLGEGTTCSTHKQKPTTTQKSTNSTSTTGNNNQQRSPPQKFTYETATMKFEVEEVQDLAQLSRFHALSTAPTSSTATTTRSTLATKASTTSSTPSSSSTKHLI